jgi:hypothetical protein
LTIKFNQISSIFNTEDSRKLDFLGISPYNSLTNDRRISSLTTLRSSVRSAIVNYNAFQKVFRSRFDEGRANTTSSHFADLGQRQAYLSDFKVPYLKLLGKNRDSFYSTPLYHSEAFYNLNDYNALITSINTPMYDFPFLLSQTSDIIRYS